MKLIVINIFYKENNYRKLHYPLGSNMFFIKTDLRYIALKSPFSTGRTKIVYEVLGGNIKNSLEKHVAAAGNSGSAHFNIYHYYYFPHFLYCSVETNSAFSMSKLFSSNWFCFLCPTALLFSLRQLGLWPTSLLGRQHRLRLWLNPVSWPHILSFSCSLCLYTVCNLLSYLIYLFVFLLNEGTVFLDYVFIR